MFKSYYVRARLFPTIITCVPLLILINAFISYNRDQLKAIGEVGSVLIQLGISTALIFLLVQINRFVSKELFQRFYFKDELFMPSTDYLLHSSNFFESEVSEMIRTKIKDTYGIGLLNPEEEKKDTSKARRLITTACSQVRNSLRDNKILLQHNIEYGFFRNLVGGSLLAFIFSFTVIVYGASQENNALQYSGVVLAVLYLFPLLLSKTLIRRFGHYYAKILYEQFLSLKSL